MRVWQVGYEHVPRSVSNSKWHPRGHDCNARRHPAGPKDRHIGVFGVDRISVIGSLNIIDTAQLGGAHMHRCAVNMWNAPGGLHGRHNHVSWNRPDRDTQTSSYTI